MGNVNPDAKRRILDVVRELDDMVPPSTAFVHLEQYGRSSEECKIVANATGYARLGMELLRAAVSEPDTGAKDQAPALSVDLRYLFTPDSTIRFNFLERSEVRPTEPEVQAPGYIRFIPHVFFGLFFLGVILAIVGTVVTVRWLLGLAFGP